jgi:hypothetical protein
MMKAGSSSSSSSSSTVGAVQQQCLQVQAQAWLERFSSSVCRHCQALLLLRRGWHCSSTLLVAHTSHPQQQYMQSLALQQALR